MGTTYSGRFTKFSGFRSPPTQLPETVLPSLKAAAAFSGNANMSLGGGTTTIVGSPQFEAAPNAPNAGGRPVLKTAKNVADYVKFSGLDLGFLANDWTMRFWLYVGTQGGNSGDILISIKSSVNGSARFFLKSLGAIGNSLGTLEFSYRDAASEWGTGTMPVDVNQWNHISIAKSGTRVSILKNGATTGTITRTNGSTTFASYSAGPLHVAQLQPTAFANHEIFIGGDATNNGINMDIADFELHDAALFNVAGNASTNGIPPHSTIFW